MEPLLDKLARSKRGRKFFIWSVCSIVTAILWLFLTAFVDLSTDDGNGQTHPFLDTASSVVNFPLDYLPGIESWDSRSDWMSLEVFNWCEEIGLYLNCLLWGFFIVWVAFWAYRFTVGLLIPKHKTHQRA
jgi:hypothetical protein